MIYLLHSPSLVSGKVGWACHLHQVRGWKEKFAYLSLLGTYLLVYPTILFPVRLAEKYEVSLPTLLALHSGVNRVAEQEPST